MLAEDRFVEYSKLHQWASSKSNGMRWHKIEDGPLGMCRTVIIIIIIVINIAPFPFIKMFKSAAHCHSLSHSPQTSVGKPENVCFETLNSLRPDTM